MRALYIGLDLFLNNIETFNQLKSNILKVKENVTLIDSSISKIEEDINKSTKPVVDLKHRFQKVLDTSTKVRLLKT